LIEERILALDLSSKTGYASLVSSDDGLVLEDYGTVPQIHVPTDSSYPSSYVNWAYKIFEKISELIDRFAPDVLVIEETCGGSKNAFSQKILEYSHFLLARFIRDTGIRSIYIMTGQWRSELTCRLSKEEKEHNKEVRNYKKRNKTSIAYNKDGKRTGQIGKKHVSIRVASDIFKGQLRAPLKRKDEDQAEAALLGACYHNRRIKNK
jgi:hypothetical protein